MAIDVKPNKGSVRKRVKKGRGIPSGSGKTCGRGHRGQKCRSGWSQKPWREGGQTPLYRRLPKRQTNQRVNRKIYSLVNLGDIQDLVDALNITEVDEMVLLENGILAKIEKWGLKVLGVGELKAAVTVKAAKFSESAKEAIEKAGGKAELIQN